MSTETLESLRAAQADEDALTVKSLAMMLGWSNVPPREVLERSLSALKRRVEDANEAIRVARAEGWRAFQRDVQEALLAAGRLGGTEETYRQALVAVTIIRALAPPATAKAGEVAPGRVPTLAFGVDTANGPDWTAAQLLIDVVIDGETWPAGVYTDRDSIAKLASWVETSSRQAAPAAAPTPTGAPPCGCREIDASDCYQDGSPVMCRCGCHNPDAPTGALGRDTSREREAIESLCNPTPAAPQATGGREP